MKKYEDISSQFAHIESLHSYVLLLGHGQSYERVDLIVEEGFTVVGSDTVYNLSHVLDSTAY